MKIGKDLLILGGLAIGAYLLYKFLGSNADQSGGGGGGGGGSSVPLAPQTKTIITKEYFTVGLPQSKNVKYVYAITPTPLQKRLASSITIDAPASKRKFDYISSLVKTAAINKGMKVK